MKLIPKHQNKSPIKKQNWFTNATLSAAMAENPAIMTSAGWNIDSSTGEVKLDNKAFETGSPEESLRNNLAVISTFAPTHPLNAVFEMTPWIYRGGLYALGKAGNTAAKNRYIATALNDVVKETELATHEPILNVGWGPSLTIIGTHASNKPVTKFIPFNRWDVKNYKADPYGYFVTEGLSAGIMSERPVLQTINVELKKPMVQVGEVGKSGINKNTSRNLLIRKARNLGADGYIMQDIVDNKADHLNVIFKFIDRDGETVTSITPEQWTAAQDAAVARGDMAEAQRLADLHSIAAKPDNPVKGKTFAHSGYEDYNVFDESKFGQTDEGYHGKGFYFATTRVPEDPSIYMNLRRGKMTFGPHGEIPTMNYGPIKKYFYLYGDRTVPGGNPETNFFGTNDIAIVSKRNFESGRPAEIIVGKPNHIKLADAVTYDDNGVRIPLGERHNFSNPDIRYGYNNESNILKEVTPEQVQNFIDNDIIPRLLAQGHQTKKYIPIFRELDPKNDAYDAKFGKSSNAGAWFSPATNDITLRSPLSKLNYGLVLHESGGHGLRYNIQPNYKPTTRYYFNEYVKGNSANPQIHEELLKVHTGTEQFTPSEISMLNETYPWVNRYFERNPGNSNSVLHEQGAINTLFRALLSDNGKIVGKELDKVIDTTPDEILLDKLRQQSYTNSITEDLANISGKSEDDIIFMNLNELKELTKYPQVQDIVSRMRNTMKQVGMYSIPITIGGALYGTNN